MKGPAHPPTAPRVQSHRITAAVRVQARPAEIRNPLISRTILEWGHIGDGICTAREAA